MKVDSIPREYKVVVYMERMGLLEATNVAFLWGRLLSSRSCWWFAFFFAFLHDFRVWFL